MAKGLRLSARGPVLAVLLGVAFLAGALAGQRLFHGAVEASSPAVGVPRAPALTDTAPDIRIYPDAGSPRPSPAPQVRLMPSDAASSTAQKDQPPVEKKAARRTRRHHHRVRREQAPDEQAPPDVQRSDSVDADGGGDTDTGRMERLYPPPDDRPAPRRSHRRRHRPREVPPDVNDWPPRDRDPWPGGSPNDIWR